MLLYYFGVYQCNSRGWFQPRSWYRLKFLNEIRISLKEFHGTRGTFLGYCESLRHWSGDLFSHESNDQLKACQSVLNWVIMLLFLISVIFTMWQNLLHHTEHTLSIWCNQRLVLTKYLLGVFRHWRLLYTITQWRLSASGTRFLVLWLGFLTWVQMVVMEQLRLCKCQALLRAFKPLHLLKLHLLKLHAYLMTNWCRVLSRYAKLWSFLIFILRSWYSCKVQFVSW